jgi:hypothetical protein
MYPNVGFVVYLVSIDQPNGIARGAEQMKNALWRT